MHIGVVFVGPPIPPSIEGALKMPIRGVYVRQAKLHDDQPLTDREWSREDHLAKKKHEARPQSDKQKEDGHAQRISIRREGGAAPSALNYHFAFWSLVRWTPCCLVGSVIFLSLGQEQPNRYPLNPNVLSRYLSRQKGNPGSVYPYHVFIFSQFVGQLVSY